MSFRNRLALFLIATLIGVQALTAVFVYGFVRGNLIEQGRRELVATASVFMRQLTVLSERVSDDVQVLALDYALRKAVGENDQGTVLSALRNHGSRIGATRSMVVGLDGNIAADTINANAVGTAFPFADLLDEAAGANQGTALAVLGNQVYWIVVVPVRAPVPIAFIVACVPIDNAMLEKLRQLSSVPQTLALAIPQGAKGWNVVARTDGFPRDVTMPSPAAIPSVGTVEDVPQRNQRMAMMAHLSAAQASTPIVAILDYPLDEILRPYQSVITPMLLVLGAALAAALLGAMFIARGVARPLELLALTARRIAKGDYSRVPVLDRRDEIGELSTALDNMTRSIAEREAALKSAVSSLELARNEAVKANDAKSQFLSNMSHELRTPLNAIIGFSEMIHQQLLGQINIQRYVEYARHVYDSGSHLLLQVTEMLDLSAAADGRLALACKRLKPGGLIAGCIEQLGPDAQKASIALDVQDDLASWPDVDGDATKLQQSLSNIIHNAIKFTPAGGRITLTGKTELGYLKIVVADTGVGIRAEDLAVVVRPFHRRKPAFDARHQGAGIGLPFAKTIIELHGGRLMVESTPGAGTTVTIKLPLAVDQALHDAA